MESKKGLKLVLAFTAGLLGFATSVSAHALERSTVANHAYIRIDRVNNFDINPLGHCKNTYFAEWGNPDADRPRLDACVTTSTTIGFRDRQDTSYINTYYGLAVVDTSQAYRATRGAISATTARKRAAYSAVEGLKNILTEADLRYAACAAANREFQNMGGAKTIVVSEWGAIAWTGLRQANDSGRAWVSNKKFDGTKIISCLGTEQSYDGW
ncbi:hypothetical protein [Undibacterium fentianense]|uniref:Uncharacterized protein n=1 Tax=Undibacterium fentianense TaxID=2828728 RepID=A0A941IBQ2_9BURK|nr:hypothetical protein [Undibacterium fentianense]MBR7799324.1 hypothetical protein [Undibacterium fentianense]